MRKVYLILLILTAITLAGCLPQSQAISTATTTEAPPILSVTQTKPPTNPTVTATNAQPAPTVVLKVPTQSDLALSSGCTAVIQKPTPGPSPTSVFSPVSDTEWVKGPAHAMVTIIEYGDFQ